MSLKKERFVHVNSRHPFGKYRGFTAKLIPCETEGMVQVQFTLCSAGDQFCRRVGRSVCEQQEIHDIPVTELPTFLASLDLRVGYGYSDYLKITQAHSNLYAWVWKYFL